MEGDLVILKDLYTTKIFQSTPSAWRVTVKVKGLTVKVGISIHTLRMEGDFVKCQRK